MQIKFKKDFPSSEGTKHTKDKGRYYPKGLVADLRGVNALTAIEGGFADPYNSTASTEFAVSKEKRARRTKAEIEADNK